MRPLYNHLLPSKRNGEQQLTNTLKSVFIAMEITWNHPFPARKLMFPQWIYFRLRWRKHETHLFPDRFLVFPKGFHAFTLAETRVSFGGNLTETCKKVVRFRRNRSDGNTGKRNVSANGNMWLPSCFRYCFTCLRYVSVYGFLKFRPVWGRAATERATKSGITN